ncbi:unnamed protein product [Porites evermanni]|uniref:Beta-lactamase-related domain-containing protein n=1 Tax=Porites evermanni TaxID=104178 RepID=A0ABN8MCN7_9CNID|nr:unnamed protein product [Porites evermanni]
MDELMNGRTEGWTGGTNGRTGSMEGLERQMVGRTEWMDWTKGLNGWTDRQLMWRSHASVGCGYAMNHESGNVTTVVVAAYEPVAIADNIDDFIENVLPPN